MKTSKTLLIWQSVLAGLQVLAGASGLASLLPEKWAGLFVLVIGGMQVGTATYVHGLVTIPEQTSVVVAQKGTPVTIETTGTDADDFHAGNL